MRLPGRQAEIFPFILRTANPFCFAQRTPRPGTGDLSLENDGTVESFFATQFELAILTGSVSIFVQCKGDRP
jgi:hypothetical protein